MSRHDFSRVAIINRGEPAMRFIAAARDYRSDRDAPLTSIALFTEPDRQSLFVREADEAYSLGAATFVDPADGGRKVRYLDHKALGEALRATGAEAVWLGWGFVAEDAGFAQMCEDMGVRFIGPGSRVMRELGDKITSKRIAEKAGVGVAPWSGGPVATIDEALHWAGELGYPLMLKATAGGGGRGIRKIRQAQDLRDSFDGASSEALAAFGNGTLFLERCVDKARHLEVQIIADREGTVWPLGVRDCSVQRRNQKLLEETPPPGVPEATQRSLCDAAARLVRAVGYTNAGTVEFLYEPAHDRASFMEVNARLQVEHPVTEVTFGVDLVKLQLDVARGLLLPEDVPVQRGCAIEARVNAENAEKGFVPAPGRVDRFRQPAGPGIRVDTGIEEGDDIPAEFDSMIAKFIASGATRKEAFARLERALASSSIAVRGGASNKGFLLDLLRHPAVRSAEVDVGWLDAVGPDIGDRSCADVAIAVAAIRAAEADERVNETQFFDAASRGRPEVQAPIGRSVALSYRGQLLRPTVYRLSPTRYQLEVDDARFDVMLDDLGRGAERIAIGDRRHQVRSFADGVIHVIEVDGVPYRVGLDSGGEVRAPAPGIVVQVAVSPGDRVEAGQRLLVLEAMKTEVSVAADFAGVVRSVEVGANVQVGAGASLLVIEAEGDEAQTSSGDPVELAPLAGRVAAAGDWTATLAGLESLMLGYDADSAALTSQLTRQAATGDDSDEAASRREALEERVLRIFCDVASLFRRSPELDEPRDASRLSSDQYLFDYLRDVAGRGDGLPEPFVNRLRRALAHYGVTELEPTAALRSSLYRIFLSHQRVAEQLAPIRQILERRLDIGPSPDDGDGLRVLLADLVRVTRNRFPLLHDLARELEYERFTRPLLQSAQDKFYSEARAHLQAVLDAPESPDRSRHIAAMVSCPQPLLGYLSRELEAAPREHRAAVLEVLVRRYYRFRDIEGFSISECAGDPGRFVMEFSYEHEHRKFRILATQSRVGQLPAAVECLRASVEAAPTDRELAVDIYLHQDQPLGDANELSQQMHRALAGAGLPRTLHRLAVIAAGTGSRVGRADSQLFTFRPNVEGEGEGEGEGDEYVEERLRRGIHPLMARRLELWRLDGFDLERLPSAEDIYLFRAMARENQRDERLLALAEVRDLTPVRDADGHVRSLPSLERSLYDACAAIRRVQAARSERNRLQWNRVVLFVWPALDLEESDIQRLARSMAPMTDGIGLEKVKLHVRMRRDGATRPMVLELGNPGGGVILAVRESSDEPLRPLDRYTQNVVRLKSRGLVYPYELIKVIAPTDSIGSDQPAGRFVELDLDDRGELVEVDRPPGGNTANIVVGEITNVTAKHPDGMTRVILLGDPSRAMGSLSEPECRRIMAAIDRAEEKGLPLEWFAVSAGAKISMESGTENMDWIALVLRRIIDFTQKRGEINVVVTGINVGAQPYWNAEATMLMHTRGILVMTPASAMVLTGKTALDYSGGVSADDNFGIGGYERIMGPNGQAQYFAHDIDGACRILLSYYDHTYVAPGERFPRRAVTSDPIARDVCDAPHAGEGFSTLGEVFSVEHNPGRKKPFDIRSVMRAVVDSDQYPLERWFAMRDAESSVVWDAHIGGYPVLLLGLESRPVGRLGLVPTDGPRQWTPGTLFPLSSKKVARALNAASGNRPAVILANLSGFDGSPESMRRCQLEYGAEIGRAVVNFDGPIVFCVVSRYHGGAFVVFSNKLSDTMEVAALENTHASVIGGAPAAAVVFARDVKKRVAGDPRVAELRAAIAEASGAERLALEAALVETVGDVRSEHLGAVAREFDTIHSVERAREVGSVHEILPPTELRPYLVAAIERGIARVVEPS